MNKMELFKCQAVLLLLSVAVCAILADSQRDNGILDNGKKAYSCDVCKSVEFSEPLILWEIMQSPCSKYPVLFTMNGNGPHGPRHVVKLRRILP